MKAILILLLTCFLSSVYSQTENFNALLDSGKNEFKKDFYEQDFSKAIGCLEKAVSLKPDIAEAYYFLGYSYSRLNAKDGKSMIDMDLSITLKSSEQFEKVIQLTPKYIGDMVLLDPYSKLSTEWGSMAICYWHNNKEDSAMWAFKEGKTRGGFGDYILSINKKVLDLCSQNAILISSGDNFTIPLWYLQIVENYRPDVKVIDVSLLNTTWYPSYLARNKLATFDLPNEILDTIEYCKWSDSMITINNFAWIVKPNYYGQFLLRGDRVLLSLLKQNKFQNDIYFTTGFNEDSRLSLQDYLSPLIVSDKLNIDAKDEMEPKLYENAIKDILILSKYINKNSNDELKLLDNFRYQIFSRINYYLGLYDKQNAKQLLDILDEYSNEKEYPYQNEEFGKYAEYLRQQL